MIFEVVIDSNIFLRILVSVGDILDIFFNNKLKIYAPYKLKEEFLKNRKEILSRSRLSEIEFNYLSFLLLGQINFVPRADYELYIQQARELLKGHEKDEDFVALSLCKNIKIWTYEKKIFNIGLGISTKEISMKLKELHKT